MSNEFKYTREWTDEGAFPLLGFTKNWENPADYPTYEPDEMQVRKDMQSLHDEVKDFLNNELIPRVVAEDATVEAWTYAEEQRAANEVTRVTNEEQRVANEAARVAAESGRTAAEQARALAEQGRVDSTTGIVAQATEQARAASSSAVYAADSASAASASAAEATQQAGIAFTWASHAEQVANHAAAAANGADDSRIRAEESAGQAAASASSAARSESEAKRYAEQASSASSGDMLQSVYDPTGKRQDVFKYVDTKVSNIPTPDVSGQISEHNSSTSAHADIREKVDGKAPMAISVYTSYIPSAGWYRVFKSNSASPTTCLVQMGHDYFSGGSEGVTALIRVDAHATGITILNHSTYESNHYYQKLRVVHNPSENRLYIDVYYGQAGNSPCAKCIDIGGYLGHNMIPMNFESVAETVSGEVVKLVQSTAKIPNGNVLTEGSITYGTTDLTAGSSPLANGQLYFVYE